MSSSDDDKSKKPDLDNEFTGNQILLKDNVLILYRDLYQISNISSLSIRDQSWRRPVPSEVGWFFFGGLVAIAIGALDAEFLKKIHPEFLQKGSERGILVIMGVIAIAGAVIFALIHQANAYVSRHSLTGIMNAGNYFMIVNKNERTLWNLFNALGHFMAHKAKQDLTINIDNSTVTNNRNGNVVALGDVGGDISNFYGHD